MRKMLLLIACMSTPVHADVFAVMWQYPDTPTVPIVGFHVYCGSAPGSYDLQPASQVPSTERATQISVELSAKRYCAVTAYNETGDSLYSNELTLVSKPNAPVDFVISGMQPGAASNAPAAATPAAARPQGARAVPLPAPTAR